MAYDLSHILPIWRHSLLYPMVPQLAQQLQVLAEEVVLHQYDDPRAWQHLIEQCEGELARTPNALGLIQFCALLHGFAHNHVRALELCEKALGMGNDLGNGYLNLFALQSRIGLGLEFQVRERAQSDLPSMHYLVGAPPSACEVVLFTACDSVYLDRFAISLILSAHEHTMGPNALLHLHLYNPTDAARQLCVQLAQTVGPRLVVTFEQLHIQAICHEKVYYICARFLRLAQLMQQCAANYLLLDSDMLLNASLKSIEQGFAGADVATMRHPHEPIFNQYNAGCVFVRNTPAGRLWLETVSLWVWRLMCTYPNTWFLDQVALYCACLSREPAPGYLPLDFAQFCDELCRPHTPVWGVAIEKHGVNPQLSPAVTAGQRLREKYFAPALGSSGSGP